LAFLERERHPLVTRVVPRGRKVAMRRTIRQ
jgi:hypothetical protein